MALLWHDILAAIAVRGNALVGNLPASLETNYLVRPLTSAQYESGDFPFSDIKRAARMAEKRIALAAAGNKGSTLRAFLQSSTSALAHKANVPTTDSSGRQIIGVWSGVYDGSDGTECTWKPADYITRKVRLSLFVIPNYNFNADGDRLLHTRTTVIVKCNVYDEATQKAAIDNNTAILLRDVDEEALVNGAVSMLRRDDVFLAQAAVARAQFEAYLATVGGAQQAA